MTRIFPGVLAVVGEAMKRGGSIAESPLAQGLSSGHTARLFLVAKTVAFTLPPGLDAAAASKQLALADRRFRAVILRAGPCSLAAVRRFEPFGALAHAIELQQLHGKAAATILGRFKDQVGKGRFPDAAVVKRARFDSLRAVGFSNAKALALKDLAARTLDGTVPSARVLRGMGDEEIIERLTAVRGVGRWTVEMLLMFRLGRLDVWPVDDFGVRKGYSLLHRTPQMVMPRPLVELGERFRPYRSVAAWYCWRALEPTKAL
jgi:3-methyladenine DNA glycosylase/8-oxoguanine DNA glycosylase